MIDGKSRFRDRPLTDTFPGAVHGHTCPLCVMLRVIHGPSDGWTCTTCGGKAGAHRFSPTGPRRGFLWSLSPNGMARVCAEGFIIDSPPARREK